MSVELGLLIAALLVSALLTGLMRKVALRTGVLDVPNARSSHSMPTPRGGGLAIVAVTLAGLCVLAGMGLLPINELLALGGGGAAVALIGFADDRRPIRARSRLLVHFAAAAWAMYWLGGMPTFEVGGHSIALGGFGYVIGVICIVWALNLFNFMDGIDGIAASEAVFIAGAGALLMLVQARGGGGFGAALLLAAASAGFLLWNWPPARIFMGDVGSGYLGFYLAVLALSDIHRVPSASAGWLILWGVFLVDATVTLVRRAARGEAIAAAHRSHAYQWLARRWGSHLPVTLSAIAVNIVWLLPCAWMATRAPAHSGWLIVMALTPVVAVVFIAGAGRQETTTSLSGG